MFLGIGMGEHTWFRRLATKELPRVTQSLMGTAVVIMIAAGCADNENSPISPGAGRANVSITLDDAAAEGIAELGLDVPVDGRVFFIVARADGEEPRLGTGVTGNPLWGVDVENLEAGDVTTITSGDSDTTGYPWAALE